MDIGDLTRKDSRIKERRFINWTNCRQLLENIEPSPIKYNTRSTYRHNAVDKLTQDTLTAAQTTKIYTASRYMNITQRLKDTIQEQKQTPRDVLQNTIYW